MKDKTGPEPSDASAAPTPSPSPPPATFVGLGPPVREEEPRVAATTAYLEDDRVNVKRTLVGPPSDQPPDAADPGAPDDTPNDAVTVAGAYDEITKVASTPLLAALLAATDAQASDQAAPDAATSDEEGPDTATFRGAEHDTDPAPPAMPDDDDDEKTIVQARVEDDDDDNDEKTVVQDEPPALTDSDVAPATAEAHAPGTLESPIAAARGLLRLETDELQLSSLLADPVPTTTPATLALALASDDAAPPAVKRRPRLSDLPPPLVESKPNVSLFPPSLESLVPPPRKLPRPLSGARTKPTTTSDAPWFISVDDDQTVVKRPPRGGGRAVLAFLVAMVTAAGLAAWALLPKTGRVLVTAAGPLDAMVSEAVVFVDGMKACTPAPCRVTVSSGPHLLSVEAPAYRRSASKSLTVGRGAEEAIHFALLPDDRAALEVRAPAPGFHVFLDGREIGMAPTTLRGLNPGKHRLQLSGNPRYTPFEQEIELDPRRLLVLEPTIPLVPGAIRLIPGFGAEGVTVEISGKGVTREVEELPARVEVEPTGTYRVSVSRRGALLLEKTVDFQRSERRKGRHRRNCRDTDDWTRRCVIGRPRRRRGGRPRRHERERARRRDRARHAEHHVEPRVQRRARRAAARIDPARGQRVARRARDRVRPPVEGEKVPQRDHVARQVFGRVRQLLNASGQSSPSLGVFTRAGRPLGEHRSLLRRQQEEQKCALANCNSCVARPPGASTTRTLSGGGLRAGLSPPSSRCHGCVTRTTRSRPSRAPAGRRA